MIKHKAMNKQNTLKALNDKIDKLIIKGINTKKEKAEFQRLTKMHYILYIELTKKA